MELQRIREEIDILLGQIERHPEARPRLHAELREKIARVESMGLALPNEYARLGADTEVEDFFENMPI